MRKTGPGAKMRIEKIGKGSVTKSSEFATELYPVTLSEFEKINRVEVYFKVFLLRELVLEVEIGLNLRGRQNRVWS